MSSENSYDSVQERQHSEVVEEGEDTSPDATKLFKISWAFGLNSEIDVCNLSSKERGAVLYACGNAIIEYNWQEGKQNIFHEHLNNVVTIAVSKDMLWLASADKGIDNSLIIWDLMEKRAVKRFLNPYGEHGIKVLKFSHDSKYLVSISNEPIQEVAIWDWSAATDNIIDYMQVREEYGRQHHIAFHPCQPTHFVTTGVTRTIFFQLITAEKKLEYYSPLTRQTDLGSVSGRLTQTVFLKTPDIALTATSVGNIITWASGYEKLNTDTEVLAPSKRKATRLIQSNYNQMSINVIDAIRDYVVTADDDGLINFYESNLELIFTFRKTEIGPITCISFSVDDLPTDINCEEARRYPLTATMAGSLFLVPDFVVTTSRGICGYMDVKRLAFTKIASVAPHLRYLIRTHPILPWLCIANSEGTIILWNHSTFEVDIESSFPQTEDIECMTFDPLGVYLAIGYKGGLIQILDCPSLAYTRPTKLQIGKRTIARLEFSDDGHYLAASDTSYSVLAYRLHYKPPEQRHLHESDTRWELLGLQQHHNCHVIAIRFMHSEKFQCPHLLSLGEDRKMVEYEFLGGNKLQVVRIHRIERFCTPIDMIWDPFMLHHLIIANSECKFRMYDVENMKCRKTVMCSAQCIPLKRMKIMHRSLNEDHPPEPYLVHCTSKLLGISLFPLDGNQFKSLSILAHPDGIGDVGCSYCGGYVFSVGESDGCIFVWKVDTRILLNLAETGGPGIVPFYKMMPGGIDGDMLKEMKNYFYFMHVRNKKKGFIDGWKASNTILTNEVADVMRALGFFPTKYEIEIMMDELAIECENREEGKVGFDDIVKLYLNHRPVCGTQLHDVIWAFDVLCRDMNDDISDGILAREQLLDALCSRGDAMSEQELVDILSEISISYKTEKRKEMHIPTINDFLPREITLPLFLENILGYPVQRNLLSPDIYREITEYEEKHKYSIFSGRISFDA